VQSCRNPCPKGAPDKRAIEFHVEEFKSSVTVVPAERGFRSHNFDSVAAIRRYSDLLTASATGPLARLVADGRSRGYPGAVTWEFQITCRSIKTLFNFDPPATDDEVRSAALQFVRKLSGFHTPSKVNEAAFGDAVEEVFKVARRLISHLETSASPRNREEEAEKAKQRAAERFG
jgi:hypothetical protein